MDPDPPDPHQNKNGSGVTIRTVDFTVLIRYLPTINLPTLTH